jgi:hypothetical protein
VNFFEYQERQTAKECLECGKNPCICRVRDVRRHPATLLGLSHRELTSLLRVGMAEAKARSRREYTGNRFR